MTTLKVHKVITLPQTLDANALYIYKDSNDKLAITVTNAAGTSSFDIPDTNYINQLIEDKFNETPVITGNRNLNLNQVGTFTIINYDPQANYVTTAINGTVTRIGDTITYQAPATGREAGFIVNSTYVNITLNNLSFVNTPSVTYPSNAATEIGQNFTMTSNAFSTTGDADTHLNTDWQIASNNTFQTLVFNNLANATNKTSIDVTNMPVNTTLYARVRHKGTTLGYGDWSPIISFTTKVTFIAKPTLSNLTNNQTGITENFQVNTSAFNKLAGNGTHASTDWQIASNSDFSTIVKQSNNDASNLTSYNFTSLPVNSTLYIRVRYKASTGSYSDWSDTITFSTKNTYDTKPVTPSITSPSNNTTDLGPTLTVTSSAFTVNTGTETHQSSSWQVASDAGFTTLVVDDADNVSAKTNINLSNLPVNTTLYIRVRYKGATIGYSDWSSTITIVTKQSYSASPNTPAITSPANSATDIASSPTITSSAFGVGSGTDTHASSSWEIATDDAFTTVIKSTTDDATNKTSWTPANLPVNTTLYARVKYKGSYTGYSSWSTTISFTTKTTYISKPSITSPSNNATGEENFIDITSSAFSTTYTGDSHGTSDWQLASDASFTTIVASSNDDATNKTTKTFEQLNEASDYYIRVRYKSTNSGTSAWSDGIKFSTMTKFIDAPSITAPTNNATNQGPYMTYTTSAFSSGLTNKTHTETDWQVASNSDFSTIVKESLDDATNKTSWSPAEGLTSNTTYYVRARHKATSSHSSGTLVSNWSSTVIFSTKDSYITTPTITSPVNNATNQGPSVTVTTSAFSSSVTGETHTSTDWQLASDAAFSTIVQQSLNDATNKTSWTVNSLPASSTLYVRAKYKGSSAL